MFYMNVGLPGVLGVGADVFLSQEAQEENGFQTGDSYLPKTSEVMCRRCSLDPGLPASP